MFFFDPLYLIISLPAILLAMVAQAKVRGAFDKYSRVRTLQGVTGAEVAANLLRAQGIYDVRVEPARGFLSDHYDPRSKTLRLSESVYNSPSVAAAGVAAHEMGHALQDAQGYTPLALRSAIVPAVQFGSTIAPWIFIAGFMLRLTELAWVGVILFAASVVFALVTLPVELDASRRAKRLLVSQGIMVGNEMEGVNKVLNAAALTYVAAAIAAITQLLYYVFLLLGRRDD